MADSKNDDSLTALFNRHYGVGEDLAIDPDTTLQSYQEEIDNGGNNQ